MTVSELELDAKVAAEWSNKAKAMLDLIADWRAMREALVEVSELGSNINDTDANIILAGLRLKP